MRFWGVTALRYIKSEEITPVELMTANEWGSLPAHSARSNPMGCLRGDDCSHWHGSHCTSANNYLTVRFGSGRECLYSYR